MIRIFSHYIPGKVLFLVALETLVLLFSIYFGVSIGLLSPEQASVPKADPTLLQALIFASCILTSMAAMLVRMQEAKTSACKKVGSALATEACSRLRRPIETPK